MPIVSINFSTSQENVNKIGLRSWKKFGAEYQVLEGENLEDAKKALKDFVYCSLKKQPDEIPQEETQKEQPLDEMGRAVADVFLCQDLNALKEFEFLSTQHKQVKAAYNQKLKQLQDGLQQY